MRIYIKLGLSVKNQGETLAPETDKGVYFVTCTNRTRSDETDGLHVGGASVSPAPPPCARIASADVPA